jgi:hypothetical protein
MTIIVDTSLEGQIDDWNTLKDQITEETDGRADSTQLAAYIRRAETRIRRALAIKPVEPMRTSVSLSIAGETASAPADMVKPWAIEMVDGGNRIECEYIEREKFTALQAQNDRRALTYAGDTGYFPRYFTLINTELRFWPAQSATIQGTLYYFQQLAALSENNQTNWMLTQHPDVYLDGSLYYAYRAMPDIEKASLMKDIFEQSLSEMLESYPDPASRFTMSMDPMLSAQRFYRPYVSTY